ncbi:MAG: magnesium transporter [Candidatus Geothermarchaeales archaeon]
MNWMKMRRIILESATIFSVAPVISMFAGLILNSEFEAFTRLPILLAFAPLLNGLAGDFGTIICSKISTSLHLGIISPKFERSPVLKTYVVANLLATTLSIIYICFILKFLSSFLGLGEVHILSFLLVGLLSSLIIIGIISSSSIIIAFISYSRGLDPANVAFPIVTAIGDLSGAGSLILVARLIGLI